MNILLGLTGSVAATLAPKMVEQLMKLGHVRVIVTEAAKHFYSHNTLIMLLAKQFDLSFPYILDDDGEWSHWHKKGDPIDHIDMRKWADVIVIAPMTANTLAKMANGICDNLLLSTLRAWDWKYKPVIVAPAMNTLMWEHPTTAVHLESLTNWGATIIQPVRKLLACGDDGIGAMNSIDVIVEAVKKSQDWLFPLQSTCNGVPVGDHPGAFGYRRKHDVHTGVDLYTQEGEWVRAMEAGVIVGFIPFTGPKAGFPWWLNTDAVLIKGRSGVICYGEIKPVQKLKIGQFIRKGQFIAEAVPVLPPEKLRSDIPGHSVCMLHVELYTELYADKSRGIWEGWALDKEKPEKLLDPTAKLLAAKPNDVPILTRP